MLEIHREIVAILARGGRCALATIISTTGSTPGKISSKLLVREDGSTVGTVGGGCTEAEIWRLALQAIGTDESVREKFRITAATAAQTGLLCGGEFEVYIEPLGNPVVCIFGAGHIARALVPILATLDYRIIVVDDRETFASREHFPQASEVLVREMDRALEGLEIHANCFLLVVTRGHQYDESVLGQALRTEARYVGVIGSRGKIGAIRRHLAQEGFSEQQLDRIRGPMGIPIASRTPQEIAVSIAAELIAVRRRAALGSAPTGME